MSVRTPRRGTAIAGFAACALGIGACGGDAQQNQAALEGAGGGAIAQSVSLLSCQDWNDADASKRLDTIAQIESFASGPVTGEGVAGEGSVLPEEQAYKLFERQCEPAYAAGFRLYKLYTQATGFAGVPAEE